MGVERIFAEISEEAPEFAGFHFENGAMVVSMTDLANSEWVRARTDDFVASRFPHAIPTPTRFRQVEHSFTDLRAWRDRLAGVLLSIEEAIYLDLDEVENKVVIGLEHRDREALLRGYATALEVPSAVVEIRTQSRFRTAAGVRGDADRRMSHNLGSRHDSVFGGVLIKTFTAEVDSVRCSLWLGGRQGSDSVYLTASHCGKFATLESGGFIAQRTQADTIGLEEKDPASTCVVPSTAEEFPGSEDCRYADAALYEAVHLSRFTQGRIAETTNSNGSTTMVHNPDSIEVLTVSGEIPYPIIGGPVFLRRGEVAQVMGKSSGWRTGDVYRTCVFVFFWPPEEDGGDEDYTLRCQHMAEYISDEGDSGGPIFVDVGGEYDIMGIHVGRTGLNGDTSFFSSMDGIEFDLGGIATMGVPFLLSQSPRGDTRVNRGDR